MTRESLEQGKWERFHEIAEGLTNMSLYDVMTEEGRDERLIREYQRLKRSSVNVLSQEDLTLWDDVMVRVTSSILKLNYCPIL